MIVGLKAIAGGSMVVLFTLVSDRLKPKTLAGIFSGAPSVALASLALIAVAMGSTKAAEAAHSMIAGAAGLVAFCVVAVVLEQRAGSITSSAVAWLAWALVAGSVLWLVLG